MSYFSRMVVCALIGALVAAPVVFNPTNDVATVAIRGKTRAWQVSQDGVSFSAKGPETILLKWFAPRALRGSKVTLTIERDEAFRSENSIMFKKRGGPRVAQSGAVLGLEVPDGKHNYTIKADKKGVLLAVTRVKGIRPEFTMTPEIAFASAEAASPQATEIAEAVPPDTDSEADAEPNQAIEETLQEEQAKVDPVEAEASQLAQTQAAMGGAEEAVESRLKALRKARRVAVYDMELQGVDNTIGAVVTESLLAEVRKLEGISAIGMDEIRDMLSHEASKQLLGCEQNECLADIAGALGVDDLVSGTLSKSDTSHVMVVRRIDQVHAKVEGVFNKRLKAEKGQEFLLSVGPAVAQLFPDRALRQGAKRGVADEIALRLDPPPLPEWSFYAAAGTSVAAAMLGGVFGLLSQSDQSAFNDLAAQSGSVDGNQLTQFSQSAEDNATRANIAFVGAGVLAVGAAVMYLFTDFEGYSAEQR